MVVACWTRNRLYPYKYLKVIRLKGELKSHATKTFVNNSTNRKVKDVLVLSLLGCIRNGTEVALLNQVMIHQFKYRVLSGLKRT